MLKRALNIAGYGPAAAQAIALTRVAARMLRSANGPRLQPASITNDAAAQVAILAPVLNEEARIQPCLEGLQAQGAVVNEIIVIDGGSTDGTRALVEQAQRNDQRIRLLDAPPAPVGTNSKAWQLEHGRELATGDWILTIDADVRPSAGLVEALIAHATTRDLNALSIATPQFLPDAATAVLHPSMLATLVYRYGIPGGSIRWPDDVQANGQCFLVTANALANADGFRSGYHSISEDVTLARTLVEHGQSLAFIETASKSELLHVEMYTDWCDTWENWSRSLPMRDTRSSSGWWGRMMDMTLTMGLPIPLLIILLLVSSTDQHPQYRLLRLLCIIALCMRLGVTTGTRRAYHGSRLSWTYWLSPLADPAVVVQLWRQAFRHDHTWRGRALRRA